MSTVPQHWVYRVGLYFVDRNGHRAMFSETWLSEQPEDNLNLVAGDMISIMQRLRFMFGPTPNPQVSLWRGFWNRIYPAPINAHNLYLGRDLVSTPLNVNAPEAALRLQRVGAKGDRTYCGRITVPVLDDTWFVDLPHRRRINLELVNSWLDAGIRTMWQSFTIRSRTYTHVVYSRRDSSWASVTAYILRPSTVRIWQRWRTYDPTNRPGNDATFAPDEYW